MRVLFVKVEELLCPFCGGELNLVWVEATALSDRRLMWFHPIIGEPELGTCRLKGQHFYTRRIALDEVLR